MLTKRQKLETWLNENYKMRYNKITNTPEFAEIQDLDGKLVAGEYCELDDRQLQSMLRRIDGDLETSISVNLLISVVTSDFSREFNPLRQYFYDLPKPGAKPFDNFYKLANTINLKDRTQAILFEKVFKNWLVASVANVFVEKGCQNQNCLVLISGQGGYKTTWLNTLCPKPLRAYSYSGHLDLQSKDTFIMVGTNFIINIDDQLDNLVKKDTALMKTLITQHETKRRLPFGKMAVWIPRTANFVASLNNLEFLRDDTGNRRFLPFELSTIDIDTAQDINMNAVWAEAYHEYQNYVAFAKQNPKAENPHRYYMSSAELNTYFEGFSKYTYSSVEEELLFKYFELAKDGDRLNIQHKKYMASEIEGLLVAWSKTNSRLNSNLIGKILKKHKCLTGTKGAGQRCYVLRAKTTDEINADDDVEVPEVF
jgi:predicted P-loop ATPase